MAMALKAFKFADCKTDDCKICYIKLRETLPGYLENVFDAFLHNIHYENTQPD
jgi:hypothetical protein